MVRRLPARVAPRVAVRLVRQAALLPLAAVVLLGACDRWPSAARATAVVATPPPAPPARPVTLADLAGTWRAIDVEAPRPAGGRLTLHPRPGNGMLDSLVEEYGHAVGGDDPAKRVKAMLDLMAAHKRGEADPAFAAFWIATREFRVAADGHTTLTGRPGDALEAYRKLTTEVTPAGAVTVSGPVPGGEMELLGDLARDTLTWRQMAHQTAALAFNTDDVRARFVRIIP